MNQVYFSCQELQKFLERQWLKLRGIIVHEPEASEEGSPFQDAGTSDDSSILGQSSHNVGQTSSGNRKKSALWTGSMDVIVEQCSVIDIVSVIDTTCETLTRLLDAGHGYRKYYVLLLEVLLKLLTTLKDVERQRPDVVRQGGIFSQLKVSVSITYALVEKVSARQQVLILFFKFRQLACTVKDSVPEKLRDQINETKLLLNEVVTSIEGAASNPLQITVFRPEASHSVPLWGINKLTVSARHRRSVILNGDVETFFICDPDIKVVYTVQTWLNNPNSLFNRAKRLSASVECSSGKVYSIGVPGYPNKEPDLQNRTALIVSGFEQAQVRSLLPIQEHGRFHRAMRKDGALLEQDQNSSGHDSGKTHGKHAGELLVHSNPKYQKYRGEIVMSNMILKLVAIGQPHEVRKLSLEGKKHKTKVWYKCCVELTGEVLAIYRQKRRSKTDRLKDEGVFHTLGIGNHPQLRDIIICSFVAMGLNSHL